LPFDVELADALEVILGLRPPAPEYDAFVFFDQWLAERNLGLVPIARPADFDWPGHWIARVRAADDEHAVVMFGSPPVPFANRRWASMKKPSASSWPCAFLRASIAQTLLSCVPK